LPVCCRTEFLRLDLPVRILVQQHRHRQFPRQVQSRMQMK
jgi:hypothetical protein